MTVEDDPLLPLSPTQTTKLEPLKKSKEERGSHHARSFPLSLFSAFLSLPSISPTPKGLFAFPLSVHGRWNPSAAHCGGGGGGGGAAFF